MNHIKKLTPEEAERQLKMNLSLIEMLKGNTKLEVIARFREMWVEPIQEHIRVLKAGQREAGTTRDVGSRVYSNAVDSQETFTS